MQRYIDLKTEATRVQNDARFSEVMNGIARIGEQLDMQRQVLHDHKAAIDLSASSSEGVKRASEALQREVAASKWNTIIMGFTVLSVVLAVWALWVQAVEMTTAIHANPPEEETEPEAPDQLPD